MMLREQYTSHFSFLIQFFKLIFRNSNITNVIVSGIYRKQYTALVKIRDLSSTSGNIVNSDLVFPTTNTELMQIYDVKSAVHFSFLIFNPIF